MPRQQVYRGRAGEEEAKLLLFRVGVEMIERIETGWKLVRWINKRNRIAVVHPNARVSGDFRGLTADGQSVLVEVKNPSHENLRFSDFQEHQREALDVHSGFGGLSLIVWIRTVDSFVLRWPVVGLTFGRSLKPEEAAKVDLYSASLSGKELSSE